MKFQIKKYHLLFICACFFCFNACSYMVLAGSAKPLRHSYITKVNFNNHTSQKGVLINIYDSLLVLEYLTKESSDTFLISSIKSISIQREGAMLKGVMIGVVTGFFSGFAIGIASHRADDCPGCNNSGTSNAAMAGGAIVGGIGAMLGAATALISERHFTWRGNISAFNNLYPQIINYCSNIPIPE